MASEGLLDTEGFFWIPNLAGPTTIAARQAGSGGALPQGRMHLAPVTQLVVGVYAGMHGACYRLQCHPRPCIQ